MDLKQSVIATLGSADFIVNAYLADLKPEEMLKRPVPGANHIAWQLGHLIHSEWYMVDKAAPGRMAALPAGFAERHHKKQANSDDPANFMSKEEYQKLAQEVRAATLKVLEGLAPTDFLKPVSGVPPFVKNVGEVFLFQGTHWTMHAGQWAVTRRTLGRPPLF